MSKRILMVFLVAGFAMACGDDDDNTATNNPANNPTNHPTNNPTNNPEMPPTEDPTAETQAVLDSIQGYETWPILGENTSPVQSEDHMGMFVVTRRNDVFGTAMTDGSTSAPVGSIIVKENYMNANDPMPMALTIMAKPTDSDWYWVQSMPNGKVMLDPMGNGMQGKDVPMCEFHRRQKLTDDELYDLVLYVVEGFFRQADQHLYWEFVDLDRECWSRGPMGVPLVSWTSIKDAWPPGIETRPTQLKGAPRFSGLSEVGAVKGFRSFLTAITATPDGRFVTAHGSGVIQLVDPMTGKKEQVAKLDTPMGLGSVWMTEAGVVVAHSRNKVFALADGKLSEMDFLGLACTPSPDGTRVAIGDEGEVRMYSLPDLTETGRFQAAHGVPWQEGWSRSKSYWPCIWSLSFIDEKTIVVSHTFPIISFWNIDSHERLNVMIDYEIPRPSIARSGRIIAHAGTGLIRVISADGSVCGEHRHAETTFRMSCAGLGRGGRVACTQYSGSTIRVWDAETGNLFAEVPCRKNEPFAVSDSMLACVHPETRQLTFYELPMDEIMELTR